jgi:phosphomethylpyrimidine synthase
MKITQDVRDYTAAHGLTGVSAVDAGLKEKAEEFRESGGEIYVEELPQVETSVD